MTRIIGKFGPSGRIGDLVASLKEAGIPRQDMIISNDTGDHEDLEDVNFLQTETEELGGTESYAQSVDMQVGKEQVLIAVEIPKRRRDEVVETMQSFGATKIRVD
jgi:hypothetical protein